MRNVASDLLLNNAMPSAPRNVRAGAPWSIIFSPEDYLENNELEEIENSILSESKIMAYSK